MSTGPALLTWYCGLCRVRQPMSCPRCIHCGGRFSGRPSLWRDCTVGFDGWAWGNIMDRQQRDRELTRAVGAGQVPRETSHFVLEQERFERVHTGCGNCFFDCRYPAECRGAPCPYMPPSSRLPSGSITLPSDSSSPPFGSSTLSSRSNYLPVRSSPLASQVMVPEDVEVEGQGEADEMNEGGANKMDEGEADEMYEEEANEMNEGGANEMNEGGANEMNEGGANEMDEGEANEMDEGEEREEEETYEAAKPNIQRRRSVAGCRWEEDDEYEAAEGSQGDELRRMKSTGDYERKYSGRSNVHPWKK